MPLKKGFLNTKKYHFNKQFVVTSILLSIFTALVWYYLLVLVKEAFRIITYGFTHYLLILDTNEIFFYNWFYANIALIIGLSVGIKFLFESSLKTQNRYNRVTRSYITTNQTLQTWNYILWFTKVFVLFGAFVMGAPIMYFEMNFFKEMWYFFPLFILGWYINLWHGFYRLKIKNIYKYIAVGFIVLQILSGLMALNNVLDIDQINKNLHSGKSEIELPESDYYTKSTGLFRSQITRIDLYLGVKNESYRVEENLIIIDFTSKYLTKSDSLRISNFIHKKKSELSEYRQDQAYIFIYADKRIRVSIIYKVKEILAAHQINTVYYSVLPKGREFKDDYPGYLDYAVRERVPLNCYEVKEQIDSLKKLGYKAKNLKFPNWLYCYRGLYFKETNRIKVTINKNEEIFINNLKVTIPQLSETVFSFFRRYNPEGIILLDIDQSISYNRYIEVKSSLYSAVLKLRVLATKNKYSMDYQDISEIYNSGMREKISTINLLYPMNIIELTETDKFLYEFSKQ